MLARDVSGTVSVAGQEQVAASLILDAGTGLICAASVDESVRGACVEAARTALTTPAGPLLPQRPAIVIHDETFAEEVLAALVEVLSGPRMPVLRAGPIPAEAEDVFDSLVGHLAGRDQPAEQPDPQDWADLYAAAYAYCRARPWRLWSDADRLHLTLELDGATDGDDTRYAVIVYGGQGVQRGLAAVPATSTSGPSSGLSAGSLVLWLEPVDEVPSQHRAKARRHGWPEDAELVPISVLVVSDGLGDLDVASARRLTLALTAVTGHCGPRRSDTTAGTLTFADGASARYTLSDVPRSDPSSHLPESPAAATAPAVATAPAAATAAPAVPASWWRGGTVRLRVTMREVEPRVVRVVDVPGTVTLPELHDILQVAIGWTDSHLHLFETADGRRYGTPDLDWGDDIRDEAAATLRDVAPGFTYEYDFGDGWEHDVELLGRGGPQPGCVDGEGACPPEDCGGPHGYAELLEALAGPAHPDHDHLRDWASSWSPTWSQADRQAADALVRAMVGQVPGSVRLLLDLVAGSVKLTAGGRLPRAVVRAVQEQRPHWGWGKPAHLEDDLPPLAQLHDLLRHVGLLRLARGVLAPTKAAGDDQQIIRRLRRVFEPDSFHDILAGVGVAHLAARGALPRRALADLTHPWLERWSVGGRPVTPRDVDTELSVIRDRLEALDLVRVDGPRWHPGPSARTLLPRAIALAHLLNREGDYSE